jgi:hypothetical protein
MPEDFFAGIATPDAAPSAPQAPQEDFFSGLATPAQAPQQEDFFSGLATPAAPPKLDMKRLDQDETLMRDAVPYYREVLGRDVSPREAADQLLGTYRWSEANTAQNAIEWRRTGKLSEEQRGRFARMRSRLDNDGPAFWQEGGGGIAALGELVAKGAVDPVNAIGGPVLRVAGKALPAAARFLGTRLGGIVGRAGVDAAGSVAGNVANQNTEINVGLRDHVSLGEAGAAGVIGAGLSGAGSVLLHGRGTPDVPLTGDRQTDAIASGKIGAMADTDHTATIATKADRVNAGMFDNLHLAGKIQEAAGTGTTAGDLRAASRQARQTNAEDPGSAVYTRGRLLAATAERSDQHLMEHTFDPAEHGAVAGSAEAGYGRVTGQGLKPILDEAQAAGVHSNHLFLYNAAMRAVWIEQVRNPFIQARAAGQAGPQPRLPPGAQKPVKDPILTPFSDPRTYTDAGFTPAQAQQMATGGAAHVVQTLGQMPGMQQAFQNLQGYFERLGRYQVKAGVISPEAFDAMRGAGVPNPRGVQFAYDPWVTVEQSGFAGGGGSRRAPDGSSAPGRKQLTGSIRNLAPGLDRAVVYTKRSIAASDRNLFNLQFVDTANKVQASGGLGGTPILRKLDNSQANAALDIAKRDAEAALTARGLHPTPDQVDIHAASILAERHGGVNANGRHTVVAFRNGVPELYEIVDPEVAKMFANMAPEEMGAFVNTARFVAKVRSELITGNPVFMMRDFIRNSLSAGMNSQFNAVPFAASVRGLGMLAKGSKLNPHAASRQQARDFISEARRSGVGFSSNRSATQLGAAGGNTATVHSMADYAKSNFLVRGWQGWQEFGNMIEMSARLSEYAMARKAGMSGPAAAFLGREVATDFARRGGSSAIRNASGVSSFLNASIQGIDRARRSVFVEKNPGAIAGSLGMIGALVAAHAYNAGQEQYDNLPEQQRASAGWFTFPKRVEEMAAYLSGEQTAFTWEGDPEEGKRRSPEGFLVQLPVPQEIAATASLINGFLEAVRTGNGNEAAQGAYNFLIGSLPGVHVPDIAQPAVDLARNKDGLGRPITPSYLESAPAEARAVPGRTAEWAIDFGELQEKLTRGLLGEGRSGIVLFTPTEIEYVTKHFFPGIVAALLDTAGQAGRNEGQLGPRPTPNAEQAPVFPNPAGFVQRAFFRDGEGAAPEIESIYSLARRVDAASRENETAQVNPRTRGNYEARNLSPERQMLQQLGDVYRPQLEVLRAFQTQAVEVEANPDLSADEKRRQLDGITGQRNRAAQQMYDAISKNPQFSVLTRTWLNPNPENNRRGDNLMRGDFLRRPRPPQDAIP